MLRLEGLGADIAAADVPFSRAARAAIDRQAGHLVTALSGGDDYEILCAVPPDGFRAFETAARASGLTVAHVGDARRGSGVTLRGVDGAEIAIGKAGFQHF